MSFWNREATLTVGNRKYSIANFDFSFDIDFDNSAEPPVAGIQISNLSPETRSSIKKNDQVILNAGYEDDVGCILTGQVVGLKHKQNGVDWSSYLTVQPCADKVLKSKINKTYAADSTASSIVRDMLNIFGVEIGRFEFKQDKVYKRGRVCKGNLKSVLTKIVVNECKSRLFIRPTGQVYIMPKKGVIDNGITLSAENGLLSKQEEKVEIAAKDSLDSKTSSKNKDSNTTSISCLLNHRISTQEIVKVQSNNLNGRFIVVGCQHRGSRTGDWKTTLEIKPYK